MRRILAHPDPLTTRIGERPMTMRSPVQPPAMLAERRRLQQSEPFPADRPVRRRNAAADSGMAGPAGGDAGYVDRPDGAPDPGARSDQQPGLRDGGRS